MKAGIDYVGLGAGAFIINDEGKILLTKRGEGARNQVGKWETPGGGVEFGETAQETVIREIKEELGVDIEITDLLCFVDDIIESEGQHWAGPTYLAKIVNGEPQILEPENCEEIGWYTIAETE